MNDHRDGKIIFVTGKTRSGKTTEIIKRTKSATRLIVWDPKPEFYKLPGFIRVNDTNGLINLLTSGKKHLRIAYVPKVITREQFDFWAGCAYKWGRSRGPCTVIAEETADITSPGKATHWWGQLIRKGLGYGIDIYATTQRPSESDSTALGNASVILCFSLVKTTDRKCMADNLGCQATDIPRKKHEFIEMNMDDGVMKRHNPVLPGLSGQLDKPAPDSLNIQSQTSKTRGNRNVR